MASLVACVTVCYNGGMPVVFRLRPYFFAPMGILLSLLFSQNVYPFVPFSFLKKKPTTGITCPANYIEVPVLAPYVGQEFCVAQFEAKQSGSVAVSQPGGTPWVSVNRANARTACQANGTGHDLISNAQWQAIARNVELQPSNWISGIVGSSGMFRGHSDDSPSAALSVTNTSDPYNQTGNNSGQAAGAGKEQRRTHTLSNGKVIWDFAGNVFEWVRDDNNTGFGTDEQMSLITATSHPTTGTVGSVTGNAKTVFGPSGNYTSLNSGDYGGLGIGWISSPLGGILRSSYWADGPYSGIFYTYFVGPVLVDTSMGFRCVYQP